MNRRQTIRPGYVISTLTGNVSGIEAFAPDNGTDTAIVVDGPDGPDFFILNGDWHDRYEACSTLEDCLFLFSTNQEHKSVWSNDYQP